jgi:hypothetical protein
MTLFESHVWALYWLRLVTLYVRIERRRLTDPTVYHHGSGVPRGEGRPPRAPERGAKMGIKTQDKAKGQVSYVIWHLPPPLSSDARLRTVLGGGGADGP